MSTASGNDAGKTDLTSSRVKVMDTTMDLNRTFVGDGINRYYRRFSQKSQKVRIQVYY